MIFNTLNESNERGELLLIDGGFCHWHLRRDGQLTIREIISNKPGAGQQILNRLRFTVGATSLFAKCPVELPANDWYKRRGFSLEETENTKSGAAVNHWRLVLANQYLPNANGIELIYCADRNKRFMNIALDTGFLPGVQLPSFTYYRPYMADQEWKSPDRAQYMAALAEHKPRIATVLDWEQDDQLPEVMSWANEASEHCEIVVIIPKVWGGIQRLPRTIKGKEVRLGYSVPTKFGATDTPLSEFQGWPVHLLGGSPHVQLHYANLLDVKSADSNYMQKMATQYCQYWTRHSRMTKNRHWPTLQESDGGWSENAIYEAFRRSCHNIMLAWKQRETQVVNYQLPLFKTLESVI